jgi:hypothetical protein
MYFGIGLGAILLVIVGATLLICRKAKTNPTVYKIKTRLSQMVFWSMPLRAMMVWYL